MKKTFETTYAGKPLKVETGHLALHAGGSCTVQYGNTMVLATATMSDSARDGISFFPLMVDYEEKLYAVGKIKGSRFIKREGRPTDEAVLTGRMIDRGFRPLFNQDIRNDVQVIISVLSYDEENSPDVPAIIAGSIALHISDVPWNGPLAGVRVGYIDNEFIINPTVEQIEESALNLMVSSNKEKILMVESGAYEVSEDIYAQAFEKAIEAGAPIIDFIEEIRKECGKDKREVAPPAKMLNDGTEFDAAEYEKLSADLDSFLSDKWQKYLFNIEKGTKKERKNILSALKDMAKEYLQESLGEGNDDKISHLLSNFETRAEAEVTRALLEDKTRIDGRSITDIRDLSSDVSLFPCTHGSGVFSRGETQVASVLTLGSPGAEQILDGMEEMGKKRYMHHYNFPPYSVGEVSPLRGASRRDIGHGALAEKALIPVLPDKEDFPYTIRVVSEVLGSNGSSSMASACGSSLALMDGGVPIKRPVAGVAIGLASDGTGAYQVITDIQDFEDGQGGMDFKVCGTTEGITAIQMDTKTDGLTIDIIREALTQAKDARERILNVITSVLPAPREELSPYAPRIISFRINPDKIREVIGPGGKMINEIIDETGVEIDIEDDGLIMITSVNQEGAARAKKWIEEITEEPEVGKVYDGTVVKIMDFGAFVEILPGQEGLVHVSEISHKRTENVGDVLKQGMKVKVKLVKIDDMGRLNLSMKALIPKDKDGDSGKDQSKKK